MLKQITPLIPVSNLENSIQFFCDILKFKVGYEEDGYAYLHRDNVAIRLINAAPNVDTHDPKRQIACYIDVEGVDELYEELRADLEKLPEGRVRAPFNQDYGQREFHVTDEDSLLIFFGESIKKN